jgi:hypothetical protein
MMSATVTSELWRLAEAGDVEEVERILSRGVDVNARNKYGMTALMRAAYHGHERTVRALLDHGANPNLARNDRFTAVALAAFFGHTETVKTLIEHGATTEVVTRCGTSAFMWAKARTFEEAARCLKSRTPEPVPAHDPVVTPAVKVLKDPPEIWDLVHEAPQGFNPRSAFVSRLKSMGASFALRAAAVLLISIASVVGVWVLRGSEARSLEGETDLKRDATSAGVDLPKKAETRDTADSTGVVKDLSAESQNNHHTQEEPGRVNNSRKLFTLTRESRTRFTPSEPPVETSETVEAPAPPALTVATPQFESRKSSETTSKPKTSTGPSHQLVAPVKNSPPKGKVIQWP